MANICADKNLRLKSFNHSAIVARENRERLNRFLEECHLNGNLNVFLPMNQCLRPIEFPGVEYFTKGEVKTAVRVGNGHLIGMNGGGPSHSTGAYSGSGKGGTGGTATILTRIDGHAIREGGASVLNVRGVNMRLDDIGIRGQVYLTDATGEGPNGPKSTPGPGYKTPIGINIESRFTPATGYHLFRSIAISECETGICASNGYYDKDNYFVSDDAHADNGDVQNVIFTGCNRCFVSEGIQSSNWSFYKTTVNGRGGAGLLDTVVFDLQRVQGLTANIVAINDFKTTLLRLGSRYYNPFTRKVVINDVKWDRAAHLIPGGYARLIHYDGIPTNFAIEDAKYCIRITGEYNFDSSYADGTKPLDVSRLIDVPKGFPLDDVLLDICGLDGIPNYKNLFENAGGGWVRPTPLWYRS